MHSLPVTVNRTLKHLIRDCCSEVNMHEYEEESKPGSTERNCSRPKLSEWHCPWCWKPAALNIRAEDNVVPSAGFGSSNLKGNDKDADTFTYGATAHMHTDSVTSINCKKIIMRIMIVAMADILTCRRVLCDREVIPEIGFKGQNTREKLYLSKVQLYRDDLPSWMLKWANIFHGPVKCLSLYLWYVCILHSVPTFEKSYWKKTESFWFVWPE